MTTTPSFSEEKKDEGDISVKTVPGDGDGGANTNMTYIPYLSVPAQRHVQPVKNHADSPLQPSKGSRTPSPTPFWIRLLGGTLRSLVIDIPLTLLFTAIVAAAIVDKVHDKYLAKQIDLMKFQENSRDFLELTYYHRYCEMDDEISATSNDQLLVPENATAEECVAHQMTHGVSVYRNLLTPETMHELREFIVEENKKQDGFYVIENDFRYSWGIDVNMHPAIKKYWKELGSNELLVKGIQAIVGPDPAIIEFTAITSAYGAADQFDHQDVIPPGNGIKYAHSYMPSYSLFIPLQDTSYDMGATHVCPGSHLCADGAAANCMKHNLAMSGEEDKWPKGWGALVNQQTTHKGMGHSKEGALDRVVIICTFAPRPQTFRGLESRSIGQGGSYSIDWASWGHTFSDFVHADERMWEPLKTMRALGLVKGHGWNLIHSASMRIANSDNGYKSPTGLREFIEKGGIKFIPREWQVVPGVEEFEENSDPDRPHIVNVWHRYIVGTIRRTERGLIDLYKTALLCAAAILILLDISRWVWSRRLRGPTAFVRGLLRLLVLNALILCVGYAIIRTIDESNWAKDIAAGRAYRLAPLDGIVDMKGHYSARAVLPTESDILIAPEYSDEKLAGYGRVLDYAHPGNVNWNRLVRLHGPGYLALSADLQAAFCRALLESVRLDSRFLKKGREREYLPIENEDELFDLCHQDLVSATNEKIFEMVRGLNSLRTNAALGRFAKTAMQKKLSPLHLRTWEGILVPRRSWTVKTSPVKPVRALAPRQRVAPTSITRSAVHRVWRSSIPPSRGPQEPFPLAWVREGDVVEALFDCESTFYYRATVKAIVACEGTFEVEYDDGESGHGLERQCLRPFQPYAIDDEVQVRVEDEQDWLDGTIVGVSHDDGSNVLLDIEIEEDETILKGVATSRIRRFVPINVGDLILARFEDGPKWFPGIIRAVNEDGTFFVQYADGDEEQSVPLHRIMFRQEE